MEDTKYILSKSDILELVNNCNTLCNAIEKGQYSEQNAETALRTVSEYFGFLKKFEQPTCEIESYDNGYDDLCECTYGEPTWYLSCGHQTGGTCKPVYCSVCGAKVVDPDPEDF